MRKRLLIPSRVRQVPRQFSWLDQRLVRDRFLARCGGDAWALYLFLVTVADAQGLSYYADHSIGRLLSFDQAQLAQARQALIEADLIAYDAPLYQVLALPSRSRASTPPHTASTAGLRSIGEVLRQAMEGSP